LSAASLCHAPVVSEPGLGRDSQQGDMSGHRGLKSKVRLVPAQEILA
jgi:hypothetical protein